MKSKITGGETDLLCTIHLLGKYNVRFYRCRQTGFIQTEEPYWLAEAYSSAITKLDVGLVMRNLNLADVMTPLLLKHFNHESIFLDYAGGYGLFTRLMRDQGFQFYHTDPYCQNIFAEYHDLTDSPANTRFELVTAFEVLEHLVNPMEDIRGILSYSDNLFFTTELVPQNVSSDWWYFSPETGQHVAFYTQDSLEYIAHQFGKQFYTDGKWLHLFTAKPLANNPFEKEEVSQVKDPLLIGKMRRRVRRFDQKHNPPPPPLPKKESLLDNDVQEAKRQLKTP